MPKVNIKEYQKQSAAITELQYIEAGANLDEKRNQAEELLRNFIINSSQDLENYLMIAKRFDLSINSRQIIASLPDFSKPINLSQFSNWIKALSACGFYKEQIGEHLQIQFFEKTISLLQKEFRKYNCNIRSAVSLLVHAKNSGVFSLEQSPENKQTLAEILDSFTRFEEILFDEDYDALLESALYLQDVTKIELPEKFSKMVERKNLPDHSNHITSDIHLKIVNSLVEYLSKPYQNPDLAEAAWNHKPQETEYGYKIGNLEIHIEYRYGEIAGKKIREADIVIIIGEKKYVIEVDGESHFEKIDGAMTVNGSTRCRNQILGRNFDQERVQTIAVKDFDLFNNQKNADQFFDKNLQIQNIKNDLFSSHVVEEKKELESANPEPVKEKEASRAIVKSPPRKAKPAKKPEISQAEKQRKEQEENKLIEKFFELRKSEMIADPRLYLLGSFDTKETADIEEFEKILLEYKKSASKEDSASLMNLLWDRFIDSRNSDLELFLLLTVNTDDVLLKLVRKKIQDPYQKKILEFKEMKTLPRGERKKLTAFEAKSSWQRGDQERLKALIDLSLSAQIDFVSIAFTLPASLSRWEFELLLLNQNYRKQYDYEDLARESITNAAVLNNLDLMRLFVSKNLTKAININHPTFRRSLMNSCLYHHNLEMLRYSHQFFDLSQVSLDQFRKNPLAEVIYRGDLKWVQVFVDELGYKVNSNFGDNDPAQYKEGFDCVTVFQGSTAIKKEQSLEILQFLVARGADITFNSEHDSVMHCAIMSDDPRVFRYLRTLGFNWLGRIGEAKTAEEKRIEEQEKLQLILLAIFREGKEVSLKVLEYFMEEEKFDPKYLLMPPPDIVDKNGSPIKFPTYFMVFKSPNNLEAVKYLMGFPNVLDHAKSSVQNKFEIMTASLDQFETFKFLYRKFYLQESGHFILAGGIIKGIWGEMRKLYAKACLKGTVKSADYLVRILEEETKWFVNHEIKEKRLDKSQFAATHNNYIQVILKNLLAENDVWANAIQSGSVEMLNSLFKFTEKYKKEEGFFEKVEGKKYRVIELANKLPDDHPKKDEMIKYIKDKIQERLKVMTSQQDYKPRPAVAASAGSPEKLEQSAQNPNERK